MGFSSFFWLLVWAFVFACYLIVLFQIVSDLFRDRDLSGWWKALWIVFLIIAPFLSALIYVIARGRGMAERHQAAKGGGRDTDTYVPPPIMVVIRGERRPRSSSDMASGLSPARAARASWERPERFRSRRSSSPNSVIFSLLG